MGIETIGIGERSLYVVRDFSRTVSPDLPLVKDTEATKPEPSIEDSTRRLILEAGKCALTRIDPNSPEAKTRVLYALGERLTPFVLEDLIIAEQINSEEYRRHEKEISDFLDCLLGADLCPDGRISIQAIADPRVLGVARTLMGAPKTRKSTQDEGKQVLDDPDKAASVEIQIRKRIREGKNPELVQLMGIHIDSHDPENSCGAGMDEIEKTSKDPKKEKADGGIKHYFDKKGHTFVAIENNAKNIKDEEKGVQGKATFVDMVHDSHDESLIFGLKNAYKSYDPDKTLLENLQIMSTNKQILMTSQLDEVFGAQIQALAGELGVKSLDPKGPKNFAETSIVLGKIAKQITHQEERSGFNWIPDAIKEGKSEAAIRTIAYISIRNTAYRKLCGIEPGNHELKDHPESVLIVGPTSTFNRENIGFPLKTARGPLQSSDVKTTKFLFDIHQSSIEKRLHNEDTEGRIILVTGEHEPEAYIDEDHAQEELIKTRMTAMNNAALLREMFKDSVKEGRTVILTAIMHPGTREILQIV